MSPVMGITRIADVTGLDSIGIPVVMVCRPNARSVTVSQGKGLCLESARASGLMECAELYHAETITLPLRLATYEELRYEHRVVDVQELPRGRDSRFHPHLRLLWCEARDLMSEEEILVPYEFVHMDFTIPFPDGHGCFVCSSNGLASGNNFPEAISQGICEVIERDATALWQLRGRDRFAAARLDLESIEDLSCRQLLGRFHTAGMTVAAWDITTDIKVAAFACYILPREDGLMWHGAIAEGFGCHPTREVALLRALTEAAQCRLTIISGARDDFDREEYHHLLDPDVTTRIQDRLSRSAPSRRFADVVTHDSETLEEDISRELDCLAQAGLRSVAVVDLSKPLFGLAVARVIVPGLEPLLTPDYQPGRRGKALVEKEL
jgi:ribosomal protein S12 methylthiotransferase accessory factor